MDAIGADQQVALGVGKSCVGSPVHEMRPDMRVAFRPAGEMVPGHDLAGTQALSGGIQQDHQQCAAVDGELRPVVTGLAASGLRPDTLPVIIIIAEFGGRNRGCGQHVMQSEVGQFAHGMGQQIDADAQRLRCGNGLEDTAVDADLVQAQRGCQAGDAAAGDQDPCHVSPRVACWRL